MARNNPKPSEKTNWIPDDTSNIVAPSAGRKLVGWLFNVKPPAEIFNWAWNLKSRYEDFFAAQVEDWIVIDSDADEQDYATLAAYLADSPSATDRVLIKTSQTLTAQMVIPSDRTLKFLDGASIITTSSIATSVLKWGSNIVIEGPLNIVINGTPTIGKICEYDGSNINGKIHILLTGAATVTTAHHINSGGKSNDIEGAYSGATPTNYLADNSGNDSNMLEISETNTNSVVRSRGSYKFRDGLEFDLGSDANGDTYYRDAGILKRLPKENDDDLLQLTSGLPAWITPVVFHRIVNLPIWDMDTVASIAVPHGVSIVKIRSLSATIRDDTGNIYDLMVGASTSDSKQQGYFEYSIPSNINLLRLTGGRFDTTSFDRTFYPLDNAAAVDKGGGLVGIPIAGHTFSPDDTTTISGTTNYNGTFSVVSVAAGEIVITATYVSETFAGTEQASWGRGYLLIEYAS